MKASKNGFSVAAYKGDAKTLLAFNLTEAKAKDLAGFTIQCKPGSNPSYFLFNLLAFKEPQKHAQDPNEPANSSVNAPFQKFRWLHVPGIFHQLKRVFFGNYTYTITPRYFKNNQLLSLDPAKSLSFDIDVSPFEKNDVAVGFTRGFVQSQAFVRHFGKKAVFKPKNGDFIFKTDAIAGTNEKGETYTFQEEYEWLGFTARKKIFDLLGDAKNNADTSLDVLAYDLYEPDIYTDLLTLAKEGRIRMIVDNSALHHDKNGTKNEDRFEKLFIEAATNDAEIKRGRFGSIAHCKIFILKKNGKPIKVLTGSTNFSVTGLYVNSNHVILSKNKDLVQLYGNMFEEVWNEKNGSVFFAVMGITNGTGPVYPTLRKIHEKQTIFSYGISDAPGGISLYKPGRKRGVLLTGKTVTSKLPQPFSKEPGIGSAHQIHHKFVVCGFNANDPVVWCGSSNLAENPEQNNGDNLIVIRDPDLVTVFALEALALIDHFHFRNTHASKTKSGNTKPQNIIDSDEWSKSYFDESDLHFNDRTLFI